MSRPADTGKGRGRGRGWGRESWTQNQGCCICAYERQRACGEIKITQLDVNNWTQTITQEINNFHTKGYNPTLLHVHGTNDVETIQDKINHMVDDLNQTEPFFLCVDKIPVPDNENTHFVIYTCKKCLDLKERKADLPSPETYFLFQHVHVSTLCYSVTEDKHSPASKCERRRFIRRLQVFISALRNSHGGAILIHIHDLAVRDKYLDYFNELVDDKLHDMIDDDELFTDVYKKSWLSDDFPGVVQIVVKQTSLLSTLDFCTKLSLDNKIVDPLSHTVFHFLKISRYFPDKPPKLLGTDNIHESRQVQVKALFTDDYAKVTHSEKAFSSYVWNDLRLKEYISAFSKINGGGSFFVGISEKEMKYNKDTIYYEYKSKEYTLTGFSCNWHPDNNHFRTIFQDKLHAETLILRYDGQVENTPRSTIDLAFHKSNRNTYILEIAVSAVNGLLFYSTEGPESYELTEDNRIRRFLPREWFERLQETWKNESDETTEDDGTDHNVTTTTI